MTKAEIFKRLRSALSDEQEEIEETAEEREDYFPPPWKEIQEELGPFFALDAEKRVNDKESKEMLVGSREEEIARITDQHVRDFGKVLDVLTQEFQEGVTLCFKRMPNFCSDQEFEEIATDMLLGFARLWKFRESAEAQKSEVEEEFSPKTLQAIYQCAYQLFSEEKFDEARKVLNVLTLMNRNLGDAWLLLGMSEHRLDKYEEAYLDYLLAAAIMPENPKPHYWAAVACLSLEEWEKAKENYLLLKEAVSKLESEESQKEWKQKMRPLKQQIKRKNK